MLVAQLQKPHTLRTLRLLPHGIHTGQLEALHNLILMYAPKKTDFDPPGYEARVKLAILDHNENVRRDLKIGRNLSNQTLT